MGGFQGMNADPDGVTDAGDMVPDADRNPALGGEVIGRFSSYEASGDCVLLVLSMGIPCWIYLRDGLYEIVVERVHVQAVRKQMALSMRENAHWPPLPVREKSPMRRKVPLVVPVLITAVMSLFYALQHHLFATGILAHAAGLDARAVVENHEWWRSLTALMLHGDLAHLIGNLGMGLVFGWFLSRSWTLWMMLPAILLSSWVGNTVNAWYHYPDPHLSYGASTAVFALVGLLVGNAMMEGVPPAGKHPFVRLFFPLLTGIILLGWWGTSGINTDVSAHVFGLVAGIPVGLLGSIAQRFAGTRIRIGLGIAGGLAILASWLMVFRTLGWFQ